MDEKWYIASTAIANELPEPIENSRRVFQLAIDFRYVSEELGLPYTPNLTSDFANRFIFELRLRQQLKPQDFVKWIWIDHMRDVFVVKFSNPHYEIVGENLEAPEQFIS